MQNLIEIKNIHHRINDTFSIHIDQLFFQDGPIYAIAGDNRAGKSSLLRILALVDPVDTGTVTIFGNNTRTFGQRMALRRRLGFVSQNPVLFRGTVEENVGLGMRYRGAKGKEIDLRVSRLLKEFEMEESAELPVRELSDGQAQMVALLRAFAPHPEILVMDEPTRYLDQDVYKKVLDYIKVLNEDRGVMVILATKSRDVIKQLANITINMRNGKVVRILTGKHQKNVGNGKGLRVS